MSGTGDQAFALRVEGDRAEVLRRAASAVLSITPGAVRNLRIFAVLGLVFVALGVATFPASPVGALFVMAPGLFLVVKCGNRRAAVARIAACYGRSRFAGEAATYLADPGGLRVEADGYAASWSWERLAEVRDHDGGLMLVFDGKAMVIDLAPSAFTSVDKAIVAERVGDWIARARSDRAEVSA
jgi:hypothetical protein